MSVALCGWRSVGYGVDTPFHRVLQCGNPENTEARRKVTGAKLVDAARTAEVLYARGTVPRHATHAEEQLLEGW